MGGATAPKAAIDTPRQLALGAVTTPRPEVELTCRLALAHYLTGQMPDSGEIVAELLQPPCRHGNLRAAPEEQLHAIAATLHHLRIVDPACGQGAFLIGMREMLAEVSGRIAARLGRREDHQARLAHFSRQLYGVEVDGEAAETARTRLISGGSQAPASVTWGDSLVERPIFRWRERFAEVTEQGGFDLVIGNPPYVRHERIADPLGELSSRAYKQQAAMAVRFRLATALSSRPDGLAAYPFPQRCDLATLFTLLALTLLSPAGVLGFVLPIASFDAQYSAVLRSVLPRMGRNALLLQSSRQRSFPQVAVNTGVFIAGPRSHPPPPSSHTPTIRLVSLGEPLAQIDLATIVRGGRSGTSPAERLRQRVAGRVTDLNALGQIHYALKTGINRFFFPDVATIARFAIEPEFLAPVVKSPRDVAMISLSEDGVLARLFRCPYPPEELAERGCGGALAYIGWGKQQVTAAGVPWPCVSSLRGRRPWYAIPVPEYGDILCPRFFDRRFFFALPTVPLLADQTFYDLVLPPGPRGRAALIAALLNCSLSYLWVESRGRTGLGGGVRQYARCDMASLPVLDPRAIAPPHALPILSAFQLLATRPIMPVEDEMQQPDRETLDAVVAAAVGLGPADMQHVRYQVVELVTQRRARATSV